MARINKVQRDKAIAALKKAGAPAAVAASMWRLLDLAENLDPQIAELVEEDPELFAPDEDEEPEDDTPMTAQEAKRARAHGRHRLRPSPGEGSTSAERLAGALVRDARPRPQTAPATAQTAAEVLTRGVGRSADR
ncbi:hypothetical protein ACOZFM_11115 [Streptomyces arboris]|uniref:hypothetical protein n=1 Tax=Streptomyces arboris TaxID=2600619 RepID=UPI003BF61932